MNLVPGKVYGLIIVSAKENEVGVADVHISKEDIIDDNELVVSVVQPDHHRAKYDIISKCQYESARSSNAPPKIKRPQHHLDEGLITIQNVSHGIKIPRQDYQDDEASGTQETNFGSNEMREELIQIITNKFIYNLANRLISPYNQQQQPAITHYSSLHKILLVGEGDFSFSATLAKAFGGDATNIVATSLDDSYFLKENYPSAATNIGYLQNSDGVVIHEVDATKMADHDLLCVSKFDRIIYNFPLAGFFKESQKKSLKRNQKLVRLFMMNAKELLDMGGEIHITHKTSSFFQEWNLENLAKQCHLQLIEDVEFQLGHYPGYHTKYGFGGNEDFNCYPSKTYKFGPKQ